jgi:hypothetical protein
MRWWLRLGILAFLGMAFGRTEHAVSASAEEFRPVSTNLLGASYKRDPLDIEIIGSTSLVSSAHKLQSDRVLRFRLERAFVTSFLTRGAPGFSILAIDINRPTGLPDALISAVSMKGRFHQDIPGVPILSPAEAGRQHIGMTIRSDDSDTSFSNYHNGATKCTRDPEGDGL